MTDQEKFSVIGQVIVELREARERLAALEYMSYKRAESLAVVESYLRKISHRENDLEREFFFCGQRYNLDDPQFAEAMDFKGSLELAERIRQARERLTVLEERHKQLCR